jgi:hypothetical protein
MARGLAREQSKAKNLKKAGANAKKGDDSGLTPQQRNERCDATPFVLWHSHLAALRPESHLCTVQGRGRPGREETAEGGAEGCGAPLFSPTPTHSCAAYSCSSM